MKAWSIICIQVASLITISPAFAATSSCKFILSERDGAWTSKSKKELQQAAAEGNEEALVELLQRYRELFLSRLGSNNQDLIDDVIHDTFVKVKRAWEHGKELRAEGLIAFVTGVASNTITDHLRRRSLMPVPFGDLSGMDLRAVEGLMDLGPSPLVQAMGREARERIALAMSDLGSAQSRALWLLYVEGLSSDEAGEILNTSGSAVRANGKKGREAIRESLSGLDPNDN